MECNPFYKGRQAIIQRVEKVHIWKADAYKDYWPNGGTSGKRGLWCK